ncbi:DUF3667 domain-containing protein [Massilia niabensis]|uniref:DUF3667 domain-containing protein n=1 Tax=Massilia niabensis TaxID=544910 RepID=A0ABW0L4J1_9BURK
MKNDIQPIHGATHCPNCGTRIAGEFCQGCGQPAHLHVPSAREFLHEFIAHYVALEGKLWKSVALLLFRPGRLTRDYIEGKRARYVEPLRLYLSFSIIFFAIFKLGGGGFNVGNNQPESRPAQRAQAQAPGKAPAKEALSAPRAAVESEARPAANDRPQMKKHGGLVTLDEGDDVRAIRIATSIHPMLGKKVESFNALPEKEATAAVVRALSSYTPYAIFAVMPVFAALLKLLYLGSGRRYGEHLLFALHTNAFAFLTLSLWLLIPDFIPLVGFGLGVWLVFYLPTAMRKVYGGSRLVTALRWIVLMAMHLGCIVLAILAVAALAVVA